jgi:hypothetical protein
MLCILKWSVPEWVLQVEERLSAQGNGESDGASIIYLIAYY